MLPNHSSAPKASCILTNKMRQDFPLLSNHSDTNSYFGKKSFEFSRLDINFAFFENALLIIQLFEFSRQKSRYQVSQQATSFRQEFSKKSLNVTKGEKSRESLYTV